ncbi:serine hydrolase domain-containing protein [Tenacibaculum sp. M341]|uniref:serine hydrolase domain-containing protein n=1 Tax=Tenacibaculum sp. M341 TaxID=2530339 RepID=UPI001051B2FE|nr:serine hydrolase domain-containing protein [Tenacibaculum sp. M341]TCI84517.1 class A beta-lactamase-related serine hydrolase [Tenacibaculum sp. M341]
MIKYFLTLLILVSFLSCKNEIKKNDETISTELDNYINQVIENHDIPGLAVTIIQNNKTLYKDYFGNSTIDGKEQIKSSSIFPLYSTTKLITSVAVFQLIEQEKLNLNDTISKYLKNLPEQWNAIQIKHLLSHSSGLPDFVKYDSSLSDEEMIKKLAEDEMEFEMGYEYRYNQTNFWLLAQIIEKVTGETYEDFVINNQFNSNTNDVFDNKVTVSYYNRKKKKFEIPTYINGKRAHAANGINLSLKNMILWNSMLDNDQLLKPETKSLMWSSFNFKNEVDRFLFGWGITDVNDITSYGFSGGNISAFRKFPNHNTTIILLSNGYKIPAFDIIINDLARIVITELKDKNIGLEEYVITLINNKKYKEALYSFKKLKTENTQLDFFNLRFSVNTIGNIALNNDDFINALEAFKINAEVFPDWWVSYAGMAESYDKLNDTSNAVFNYKKAISLNKNSNSGYTIFMKDRIEKINK